MEDYAIIIFMIMELLVLNALVFARVAQVQLIVWVLKKGLMKQIGILVLVNA
jgi:hypothetical protein